MSARGRDAARRLYEETPKRRIIVEKIELPPSGREWREELVIAGRYRLGQRVRVVVDGVVESRQPVRDGPHVVVRVVKWREM